ncbi:hypothetical protein BHYA_0136g00320 [Botrytis hyacinthi]|uniref:Uncharacterized protein n=1 Tax=Botrytis hyacinthi TaxID=278943 RepID=A0A4Z1GLD4_9HELO|nr:hypothetical protein BHYA_0136g00320 [Botrytis hyacinthi]
MHYLSVFPRFSKCNSQPSPNVFSWPLLPTDELIAQHLGVQANDVTELMNTTDYGSIDATKWAATFNQSTETVDAWSPMTKNRMLSTMHILLNFESTEESTHEKRLSVAQRVGDLDVIRAETDLNVQLFDDEQPDKKSCLSQITCVLCVSGAVAANTGPIATCASTAYVAIAATAPETAGSTIPPIVLAFIGCAAPFVGTGLGAAAGCIKIHQ